MSANQKLRWILCPGKCSTLSLLHIRQLLSDAVGPISSFSVSCPLPSSLSTPLLLIFFCSLSVSWFGPLVSSQNNKIPLVPSNEEAERVRKNKLPKGIIFQVIPVKLDFNTSSIRKILAVLPSGMAEVWKNENRLCVCRCEGNDAVWEGLFSAWARMREIVELSQLFIL